MAILVTGGTGFLGSHLARKLVEKGEDEIILFDVLPKLSSVEDIIDHVRVVTGDFSEPSHLMSVLVENDISCIFHLGYILSTEIEQSPSRAVRVNCEGTSNLFEMARIARVKKVVWASSSAVYGHALSSNTPEFVDEETRPLPDNMYGICKLFNEHVAELYNKCYGFDHIALRLSPTFGMGRGQRRHTSPDVYSVFLIEKVLGGEAVTTPPQDHYLPWSYVKDAVEAFYCAYKAARPKKRIFNFSGETRQAGEIVLHLKSLFPKASITTASKAISIIPYMKTERISEELGFQPSYPMEKGIKDYLSDMHY